MWLQSTLGEISAPIQLPSRGNVQEGRDMTSNLETVNNVGNSQFQGLAPIPFTLRHTLASHSNNNNVDILVIQSILGHASTRSTEPYIHPSMDRIRKALEKLPGVKFVKELIRKGEIDLRFQKPFGPKLE